MKALTISKEDVATRDEYYSKERFIKLVKKTCKAKGMGFKEGLEYVCEQDSSLFLRFMLGAKPFAWQHQVHQDYTNGERYQAICCSRQIGKTKYIVAPITLWRCLFNLGYKFNPTYRNKSQFTVEGIISLTEPQAIMVLDEIRQWIHDGDEYMANYLDSKGKPIFGKKYFSNQVDWGKSNMFNLVFFKGVGDSKGQSRIRAVPATDKIRGFTYTGLIFDECAYIEDYIIESVAIPASKAIGSSTILISTPDKKEGHFYQSIDPDDSFENHKYKRYMYDVDCLKGDDDEYYGVVKEEIDDFLNRGKTSDVEREYYCDFTSSNNTFFDIEKVEGAFTNEVKHLSGSKEKVHIGIDIGGYGKSHTVVTATSQPDFQGVSRRIACWRYGLKQEANLIADCEREIFPNFNVASITIDYCSASFILYEQMIQAGWSVIQFKFTKDSKIDYYNRFRDAISTGKLLTYPDRNLLNEFNGFTDDLKPTRGSTDDMLDSWMLAASSFLGNKTGFVVKVIGGNNNSKFGPADDYEEQLKAYHARANDHKGVGGAI